MAVRKKQTSDNGMAALQRDIAEHSYHRIYLLFGEERYLVMQFRDRLQEAAVGTGDSMNLNVHRENSPDPGTVMDEALTMPFFADRRMIVVEDSGWFSASGKGKAENGPSSETDGGSRKGRGSAPLLSPSDQITAFLPSVPDTTVLLFAENSVDKRSRLYKAVVKEGLAVEFTHPDEAVLRKWILGRFSQSGVKITGGALERFLQLAGDDMTGIDAELTKLISYAGEGGELRTDAVESLVSARLENRIFDMMDALGHRDRAKALKLYDDLLMLKEAPMKILVLLTRQFNLLYQAKVLSEQGRSAAQMTESLGLKSSWIVSKYLEQARLFSLSDLRKAVEDCARTDERIKTGYIDQKLGVEMLIVRYSR